MIEQSTSTSLSGRKRTR